MGCEGALGSGEGGIGGATQVGVQVIKIADSLSLFFEEESEADSILVLIRVGMSC